MGVLDEVPNIPNQMQQWSNFWQNQNKIESEQAAGKALASGNIEQAQKEAASRGNLALYSDLHTMQKQRELELGQKMLAVVQSAKNPQQYHALIDLLTQHGVAGLNKYRVPPGGDFDATKNAALAELGTHTEYLKWQQEQDKLAAERQKATYRGIITLPGVPRETPVNPMDLPQEQGASVGAPGYLKGATLGVAPEQPTPTMSIGDISSRLQSEIAGRGLMPETTKKGEPGPERKFAYSTTEAGKPVMEPLPEGAEFEATGTKAKENIEKQIFDSLRADPANANKTDTEIWSMVAEHVKATKQKESAEVQGMKYMAANPQQAEAAKNWFIAKKGPEKQSAIERGAARIQAEYASQNPGKQLPIEQALDMARRSIKGEPPALAKMHELMGDRHDDVLKAMKEEAQAEGKYLKQPEALQVAQQLMDENPNLSFKEAYGKAMELGGKGSSDTQLLNWIIRHNPDISRDELNKEFDKLKSHTTEAERTRKSVEEQEGMTTLQATGAIAREKEKTPEQLRMIKEFMSRDGLTWDQAVAKEEAHTRAMKPESADMQMMKYRSLDEAHANQVDAYLKAKGMKDKTSPMERNVLHVMAEAEAAGKPISYTDALRIVGNATKAPNAATSELQMLLGPDHDRVLKAIQERAAAQGKGQEPEGIKMAHAIQEDEAKRGNKLSLADAYDMAKGHGAKESSDEQMLNDIREHNPGASEDKVREIFREMKTHISDVDRIRKETGLDTIASIAAKESAVAKARAEGRTVPQIFQTTREIDGKTVPGTLFVNPVTKEETFTPHPNGIGDVSKYAARTSRMSAELDEIEKIRKENPGMSELDALKARANAAAATKNPSAELQGINALHQLYPKENFEQLTKRWVTLHEKKTDKDKEIAAIQEKYPDETKADAYLRQAAYNKLTVLKKDPETGEFKAVPVEGTIEQQKLNKPLKAGNESDLIKVKDALGRDPRFKDVPEVDRFNIAKSMLNQKGYNVHIANDGNLAFQASEHSKADIDAQTADLKKRMVELRERVATDPQLKFHMKFAEEAAKNDVKTLGREAQTVVVDNHMNAAIRLAGGDDPDKPLDAHKRAVLEKAVGLLHSKLGLNYVAEQFGPENEVTMAYRSLSSIRQALQAETSRLLSMGMTGNIAHEHAKELGQIVGNLENINSVRGLLTQLKTLKELTSAIRTLPMIPGDPFEAQKMINDRGKTEEPDHAMAKKWADEITGPNSRKEINGNVYQKTLNENGNGVIWINLGHKTGM